MVQLNSGGLVTVTVTEPVHCTPPALLQEIEYEVLLVRGGVVTSDDADAFTPGPLITHCAGFALVTVE